jgi:hypothetical protein
VAPSRTSVCSMKTAGRSRSGRSPPLPTIPPAAERELVAWAVNTAHHADFADRGHAHIYQEGLRIPPVRLYRAGVLQTDVQELRAAEAACRLRSLGGTRPPRLSAVLRIFSAMIFGAFASHGQRGVGHELAPTAVRGRTNLSATDGQCAAVIASGQAAH